MLNRIIILIALVSLYGCRDFNSDNYINHENKAIYDLIHEMIDYNDMVKMNNIDSAKARLYISSNMDPMICNINEPDGYVTSVDGVKLPIEKIKESKRIYEEEFKKYRREQKLFAPLENVDRRKIDFKFEYTNLKVELTAKDNKELIFQQNDLGYLYISRIIFNRSFTKGYLAFEYYCGVGCAWSNNIEIVKVDGKWKISQRFSGWIA